MMKVWILLIATYSSPADALEPGAIKTIAQVHTYKALYPTEKDCLQVGEFAKALMHGEARKSLRIFCTPIDKEIIETIFQND